jgi:hypothetical protein
MGEAMEEEIDIDLGPEDDFHRLRSRKSMKGARASKKNKRGEKKYKSWPHTASSIHIHLSLQCRKPLPVAR